MTQPMPSGITLTPPSYIVLGLLAAVEEATPYELKQMVAATLSEFWSIQHAQLYSEPERLVQASLVTERREAEGRRRRHYKITTEGRKALDRWLAEPTVGLTELRDAGLLKLFFGGDPSTLAQTQLPAHQAKLAEHERTLAALGENAPRAVRLVIEAGIGHEREWVRFWRRASRAKG